MSQVTQNSPGQMLRAQGGIESQRYIMRVILCLTVSQSRNYMYVGSVARVYHPSRGNALEKRPPDEGISGGHGASAFPLCRLFSKIHALGTSHPMFGMTIEPFGI